MELGDTLKKRGVYPSMGHSNATIGVAKEALDHGYTHLTHFYSGMSTIVRIDGYRHPGLIEAGYLYDDLNAAAAAAEADVSSKVLVLMNDGTLSGENTIPSGVTLLIPFDSANTLYTTAAVAVTPGSSDSKYVTPTPYRTLTLAEK